MNKKIIVTLILVLFFSTNLTNINGYAIKNNFLTEIENYEYKSGEFIVKYNPNIKISSPQIKKINKKYQVKSIEKVFKKSENTILDNIYLIRVPQESNILSIVKEYSLNPEVVYTEPNAIGHLCGFPNDENFSKQWGLHNTGQNGGVPDTDIDAPEAWDIETGESNVVIGLIDSGVDYTHPDLSDNIWINEDEIPDNGIDDDENNYIDDIVSWDFIDNDAEPMDTHSHGTHCCGIACAVTNNTQGIAGVSWNSKIMPIRIADSYWDTTIDIVVKGIKYAADNNADIISMSFGWYNSYNLLKDTIDYAYEKGIVMVASAGNNGVSTKIYPAAYNNVISVAGINRNNNRMHYYYEIVNYWVISNYGTWIDVAAPSQEIYSTMPTYYVTYNGILGLDLNYDYLTGTSMAAPLVAGVTALILSRNPTLSPEEVKSIIKENVDPYDSEYYLGTGRINAYKALIASNQPPNIPEIDGPKNGEIELEYPYTFKSNDPEDDDLYYWIDWGDGCTTMEWIGPYKSGEEVIVSHTFLKAGKLTITVKTKDIYESESEWGSFNVEIPRAKTMANNKLLNFLSSVNNLLPII